MITLDEAKRQLRIVDDNDDADILSKVEEATAIAFDYIGGTADTLVDSQIPVVKSAIKVVLSSLYDGGADATIPPGAEAILRRIRKPVLS